MVSVNVTQLASLTSPVDLSAQNYVLRTPMHTTNLLGVDFCSKYTHKNHNTGCNLNKSVLGVRMTDWL